MIDRRTLPLSALRAFDAVAEHRTLRRAGEALGVTHGAISHQIRALETQLGVPLFSRKHNRLTLTPAGEQLNMAVRDGFDRLIAGTRNLDPDQISGPLFIGCTVTSAASWAIRHIMAFSAAYPQIELHIDEIAPGQQDLPSRIDVAICYGRPGGGSWVVSELTDALLYPVCSPKLLHQSGPISRVDDLGRLPLLHSRQNRWRDWFEGMGASLPEEATNFYFENDYVCQSAARRGYGVALCNALETQEDMQEGRLTRLFSKPTPEAEKYYLAGSPKGQRAAKVQLFIDWIRKAVA